MIGQHPPNPSREGVWALFYSSETSLGVSAWNASA